MFRAQFLSCDMRDIKIMKDYFIENLNNLPSDADYKSKLEVRTHEGIPTSLFTTVIPTRDK